MVAELLLKLQGKDNYLGAMGYVCMFVGEAELISFSARSTAPKSPRVD